MSSLYSFTCGNQQMLCRETHGCKDLRRVYSIFTGPFTNYSLLSIKKSTAFKFVFDLCTCMFQACIEVSGRVSVGLSTPSSHRCQAQSGKEVLGSPSTLAKGNSYLSVCPKRYGAKDHDANRSYLHCNKSAESIVYCKSCIASVKF